MELFPYALAALAVPASLALALWERLRLRRTLLRLDRMLDDAVRGTFREQDFNESLLSSVEMKMAHYLAASAVSTQALQEEKDKIKSLIANISHQTKTPLSNILLYTQLLEETGADTGPLKAQTRKLQSLIDALVKISRLETGVLTFRPRSGPLRPVLERAAGQFLPQAEEKGLALTLKDGDAQALFDPKWTEEALCNLIGNAVKYTPSGCVAVSVRAYELFARIDVEDTGPGIPEEETSRIFQRFYRGAGSCMTEGVGLGLCLARQIAEGQGGYIKVFSKPGQGAKFSFFLPR